MPVPVNRPVVNGYDGDYHGRPVTVVQHPVYAAPVYVEPVYIAPAYVYYDAGYAAPVNYVTTPQQVGFQDGLADGHNDWVTGYGFQNGYDENYVNADNGYDPDFGSLQAYQSAYRIGYAQGYAQGYGH